MEFVFKVIDNAMRIGAIDTMQRGVEGTLFRHPNHSHCIIAMMSKNVHGTLTCSTPVGLPDSTGECERNEVLQVCPLLH